MAETGKGHEVSHFDATSACGKYIVPTALACGPEVVSWLAIRRSYLTDSVLASGDLFRVTPHVKERHLRLVENSKWW